MREQEQSLKKNKKLHQQYVAKIEIFKGEIVFYNSAPKKKGEVSKKSFSRQKVLSQ